MAYEVRSSRVAYRGPFSTVRVDEVAMPDGDVATREVVEQAGAVAVVALDGDGRVVLVRQYRHPLAAHVLELPAGKLDVDGEDPRAAAQRELAEEVGLAADELAELLTFHNSSGWTDESTTLYLATGLRACAPPEGFAAQHEEADLEVVRVPLGEARAMVRDGRIQDAKTVIGILAAPGPL